MAHRAVDRAVKRGELVRPSTCQAIGCKRRKRLHAHHNNYGPRYRLKVVHLCAGHHATVSAGVPVKLKAGAVYAVARAPKAA
jgi:hypothetical protein